MDTSPTPLPVETHQHSSLLEPSPSLACSSIPDDQDTFQPPASRPSSDVNENNTVSLQSVLPENASNEMNESEDVAEKLLAGDDDDAMHDADEHDGVSSGDASDGGMWIDGEAGLSESLSHSQSTVMVTRRSAFSLRTPPDSEVEPSSEPEPNLNSPVSVPTTRHSSKVSLNSSEDPSAPGRNFFSMPSSRSTSPDDVHGIKFHISTLGGFPAYCFESYRKDPKNFPKVYYAADLPSSIQDHINSQPEEVRMLGELREVFEAMILENTADDERDAPPIMVQNNVDGEPTPPWEFWYSNKMWHGAGVPDPDMKNLKGCDCLGGCNPKNKACACAQRQFQVIGDKKASEFAYDKNGRLKFPGFPIFECNNTCLCGPECMNRVCCLGDSPAKVQPYSSSPNTGCATWS